MARCILGVLLRLKEVCHCVVAGSDRTEWPAHYLPDHGLQQLLKRLFRCLGKVAPDGPG
jgi:hypothetical protein